MKKYFLSIVALAGMLFATSCQESLVEPQMDGTTTFSIEIPSQMGTKAVGETYNLYVEVYKDNGTDLLQRKDDLTITSGQSTTFSLDLVATQEYDIVFWAQKAEAYGVGRLTNVVMNIENHHNSEDGAAYYAIMNNFKPSEDNPSVSLKRPFAQLNIGTLLNVSYSNSPMRINNVEITVSEVASQFNRVDFNGTEGIGQEGKPYTGQGEPYSKKVDFLNVDGKDYSYVSMDYLPVVDNRAVVDVIVNLNVTDPKGVTSDITRTIKSVPLQMNYKTNIVGNLITSTTDFTVTIDESWNTPNNDKEVEFREVATAEELHEAVAAGVEEIELVADIELKQPLVFPAAPTQSQIARASTTEVPSSYVLDLNGRTINVGKQAGSEKHIYAFTNNANLTIKGNGTINARGTYNYGTLVIEDGVTINAIDPDGGYAVKNDGSSTFIMNGGVITTTNENGDPQTGGIANGDATPLYVGSSSTAIIKGGEVKNVSNYTNAIVVYGNASLQGGKFESAHTVLGVYYGGKVEILSGEFSCKAANNSSSHAVYAEGNDSKITIKGGSFDVKDDVNGADVYAAEGSSIEVFAGEFHKACLGSLYGKGTITVSGGTFFDDPTVRLAEGYKAVLAEDKKTYVVIPDTDNYDIVITDPTQLTKEVIKEYSNIYLAAAGEYFVDLYDIDEKETLTITGTEGVKFAHTAVAYGQLRIEQIKNFTIRNCEILQRRVGNKKWGMMVFSTGISGGKYTIENCTFNGDGTQGIYINQTQNESPAIYNIKNCTFNGNFGVEGAITISTHQGVNHTVNVERCEFNKVPANHRIFLTEGEDGKGLFYDFTLNTDLEATTADEIETFIKLGKRVNLADGNYVMPELNLQGKTLTLVGSKDAIIDVSGVDARDQFVTGATLAFEGLTLNFGKDNYMGFANTASLTYTDCDINGLQFLFGNEVSFERCNFNSNDAEHSVWTYGAKVVNFTDCDFTYGDRCVNCYSDNDVDGGKQVVNFINCEFATANTASEGAVEINSYFFSVGIEVNLTSCTAPVYGEMAYVSPWDSTKGEKTTINIK